MVEITIIIILTVGLIIAVLRSLDYFYALCGVLYYLYTNYNDELDNHDITRLALEAKKNVQR